MFGHFKTLCMKGLRYIQAYSGIFSTLCNRACTQPCHILSPGILRTGSLSETMRNADQTYSEPCHMALFTPQSGIFRTLCNASICRNPAYLEVWNIQNSTLIASSRRIFGSLSYLRISRTLTYFKPDTFTTLSKI